MFSGISIEFVKSVSTWRCLGHGLQLQNDMIEIMVQLLPAFLCWDCQLCQQNNKVKIYSKVNMAEIWFTLKEKSPCKTHFFLGKINMVLIFFLHALRLMISTTTKARILEFRKWAEKKSVINSAKFYGYGYFPLYHSSNQFICQSVIFPVLGVLIWNADFLGVWETLWKVVVKKTNPWWLSLTKVSWSVEPIKLKLSNFVYNLRILPLWQTAIN